MDRVCGGAVGYNRQTSFPSGDGAWTESVGEQKIQQAGHFPDQMTAHEPSLRGEEDTTGGPVPRYDDGTCHMSVGEYGNITGEPSVSALTAARIYEILEAGHSHGTDRGCYDECSSYKNLFNSSQPHKRICVHDHYLFSFRMSSCATTSDLLCISVW